MSEKIVNHGDLKIYRESVALAMEAFQLSHGFPKKETYSMTDQLRRSSRSVCANLAQAWRKRRYQAMFISKLADVEGEAAETQVWLELAEKCGYIQPAATRRLIQAYNHIIGGIVGMINHPATWTITQQRPPASPRL